jgi:hypothetical protein
MLPKRSATVCLTIKSVDFFALSNRLFLCHSESSDLSCRVESLKNTLNLGTQKWQDSVFRSV